MSVNQHKQMAMKKGGSVKPPINFGPPKSASSSPPPKTGIPVTPIEKVKRVNGVRGV